MYNFDSCELCPDVGFCDFLGKCEQLATTKEVQEATVELEQYELRQDYWRSV